VSHHRSANPFTLRLFSYIILLALALSSCKPSQEPTVQAPAPSTAPASLPTSSPVSAPIQAPPSPPAASPLPQASDTPTSLPPTSPPDPYQLISLDHMLETIEKLTSIQAFSGWRTAGTQGETEALQYMADQLNGYSYLNEMGLEMERQTFPIFMTTEIWESRLFLSLAGQEMEVPVNGLRGSRYSPSLAKNFDSDGSLDDADPNPVSASGKPLLVRDETHLFSLGSGEVKDRLLFLDYTLIDYTVNRAAETNLKQLVKLIYSRPVGLVLLNQYANQEGQSHGTFALDGGLFNSYDFNPKIPVMYARLEDWSPAGIVTFDDLERALDGKIASARLVWDADVLLPAQSGNLIARIPGQDSSQAIILGAHIDSPNTPGAFDDGSGSAVLLEIARVLDAARLQPPVDLYLVWFGSEEILFGGSSYFVATHQDLLDRTMAMLQIDALGYPLEGQELTLNMETSTYEKFGDGRPTWADYLSQAVLSQGIPLFNQVEFSASSDNSVFGAFDVPNANLIYFDPASSNMSNGYLFYATHYHDPYESVDQVREVGQMLVDMTRTALVAALQTTQDKPALRVVPPTTRRALILANHSQPPNLAPVTLLEMSMALSWQGYDVDLLPYGQPLTAADLKDTSFVAVLPVLDYPGQEGFSWTAEELDLLDAYVKNGGFLVIANSLYDFSSTRMLEDANEDALGLNPLAQRFGVTFTDGVTTAQSVSSSNQHPLTANASTLKMYWGDGVPFRIQKGLVLYRAGNHPAIALVDYGESGGQVLIVADLGLLLDFDRGGKNLIFLQNLAAYVTDRLIP
jgi:hypothetical protein